MTPIMTGSVGVTFLGEIHTEKRLRHTISKYFCLTQTDLETIRSCSAFCVDNKRMAALEHNVQDGRLARQRKRERMEKKEEEIQRKCV